MGLKSLRLTGCPELAFLPSGCGGDLSELACVATQGVRFAWKTLIYRFLFDR